MTPSASSTNDSFLFLADSLFIYMFSLSSEDFELVDFRVVEECIVAGSFAAIDEPDETLNWESWWNKDKELDKLFLLEQDVMDAYDNSSWVSFH